MVRAIVTREPDGSYTVTFGDVATTTLNSQRVVNVPMPVPVPATASGTTSVSKSAIVSGTSDASMPVSAASSETGSRLVEAEKALDKAVENAKKAAQNVSNTTMNFTGANLLKTELKRAHDEVQSALDASYPMNVGKDTAQKAAAKEKQKEGNVALTTVFMRLKTKKGPTKGGRRTRRKHTKRTHRKSMRTHRRRKTGNV